MCEKNALVYFGSCKNATFTWIHSFLFLDSSEEEVKYNLKYIEYICEVEQNKYQTCAVEKLDQFIKENIQQNWSTFLVYIMLVSVVQKNWNDSLLIFTFQVRLLVVRKYLKFVVNHL